MEIAEGSDCVVDGSGIYSNVLCVFVCVSVHTYLDLTAGSAVWLTDFSHFLRGKVACTVASGDYSSETEEHRKSINSWCYYLPALWNPKWRLHIYKCSQHVTCTLSPFITNVCAASLIKVSVLLMWPWVCDKICSDKRTKLLRIVVERYNCFKHEKRAQSVYNFQKYKLCFGKKSDTLST